MSTKDAPTITPISFDLQDIPLQKMIPPAADQQIKNSVNTGHIVHSRLNKPTTDPITKRTFL